MMNIDAHECQGDETHPAWVWWAVVVGVSMALLGHGGWLAQQFRWWAMDDAYISFRYARMAAQGHGLVYNPGEWVEGYSNLLWTVGMVPVEWMGWDVARVSIGLGLACLVGTWWVAVWGLDRLYGIRSPWAVAAAGVVLASSGTVAGWAGSGMETGLHGLLLMVAWVRFAWEHHQEDRCQDGDGRQDDGRRRQPWSAVALVALAMVRPEALTIALAGVVVHLWVGFRRGDRGTALWGFVGIVAVGLAAFHLWRWASYGPALFPNTVRAKVGMTWSQLERGMHYTLERFVMPYGVLLLASVGLVLQRSARLATWAGVALFVGHVVFVIAVGGDWSPGRFFAPILPIGVVLWVVACHRLVEKARSVTLSERAVMVGMVIGYATILVMVTSLDWERGFRTRYVAKDEARVAFGRWLNAHAPEQTRVALYAAGQIAYHSDRYAHDMLGLADAHIAEQTPEDFGKGVAGHEKFDVDYTLQTVRPAVIVDANFVPGLLDHPDMAAYRRLRWPHHHIMVRRDAAWAWANRPGR